jgi:hypothetical protein
MIGNTKPVVKVTLYDFEYQLTPGFLYVVNEHKQLVRVKLNPGTLYQADVDGVLTEIILPLPFSTITT